MAYSDEGNRVFAIFAGVLFSVLGTYNLVWFIASSAFGSSVNTAVVLLYGGSLIALGVMLIISKKNLALLIATGVTLLPLLIWMLGNGFYYTNILDFLAYSALFVIALFNCIPALDGPAEATRFIWYVPAAIYLLNRIIMLFSFGWHEISVWDLTLELPALLLVGLWFFSAFWGTPYEQSVQQQFPNPTQSQQPFNAPFNYGPQNYHGSSNYGGSQQPYNYNGSQSDRPYTPGSRW